jgi:DNA-binding GntR family transcriptional regulator
MVTGPDVQEVRRTGTPERDRLPRPLLIEHENLDDKISARLKRMIAEGEIAPGRQDPEGSEAAMRVHIRRSVERLWERARAEGAGRNRPMPLPASASA